MKFLLPAIAVIIVAVAAVSLALSSRPAGPGPADALAQCMASNGAKMYGAYWCPHCQTQKDMFGSSWQYVPYIECSLSGGQGQTEECRQAGIRAYPTWEFAGGERVEGVLTLGQLGERTRCSG